jgi:UDP-glucose 4-epimerase
VLGGCGFIGSHLCRAFVRLGYAVRIFDKLYAERTLLEDVASSVEIFEGDISRPDDVLTAIGDAHTIVHLVHTTVPGSSMKDPGYDVMSNVMASAQWLSRLQETKARKIIYISSGGTVYGPPQSLPITEHHPTSPISSYGITKLAIEKYIAMYSSMYGIDYRILRPSNVYGEGQRLHIGQGIIGVLADRVIRGESLEIWGTGESLRDFLHVEDMVAAVVKLLNYSGDYHIFNVASGVGYSVLDIVKTLSRQLDRTPQVVYKPARGFDVPANILAPTLLKNETGWLPTVDLPSGVARVIRWLKSCEAA